jgi:PPOX class probable F420-dependent enzyme
VGVNQRSVVAMSQEECDSLIVNSRVMTLASLGPDGHPHLVAMWYGLVDGAICFETKAKSQKVANFRRDPRVSCLIEDGDVYEELRGVSLEGKAEVIDDPDFLWRVGVSVFERYMQPYTEESKPLVEFMLNKRVAIRINVERTRSWDHRKLGMGSTGGPGGSTVAAARRPPG